MNMLSQQISQIGTCSICLQMDLDDDQIARLRKVFQELQEYSLNTFASEDKMNEQYSAAEWNEYCEAPNYTIDLYQMFLNGEFTTAQQIKDAYEGFIQRAKDAIEQMRAKDPNSESIYSRPFLMSALIDTINQRFKKKLDKALFTEKQHELYKMNKTISELSSILRNQPKGFELESFIDPTLKKIEDHNIPVKML